MSLLTALFGQGTKAKIAGEREDAFARADEQLRKLEAQREHMRAQLSRALQRVIEDNS